MSIIMHIISGLQSRNVSGSALIIVIIVIIIAKHIPTRAVLRLECSLDCISGSPTKYFHFLTVSVSFEIKKM